MNITRVERDGVEFFTIDATGESGMSESGLAHLCGVARSSLHEFIKNMSLGWEAEKELNPRFRKVIGCKANYAKDFKPGQNSNIKILSATVCARTIEHYAFESKHKTAEALFAYRKFAELGSLLGSKKSPTGTETLSQEPESSSTTAPLKRC